MNGAPGPLTQDAPLGRGEAGHERKNFFVDGCDPPRRTNRHSQQALATSHERHRGLVVVVEVSMGCRRTSTKEHLHLSLRNLAVLVDIDALEHFRMGCLEFLER